MIRAASVSLVLALSACSSTKQGGPDAGPDGGPDAGPLPAPTVSQIAPASGPADGGTAVQVTGANFVPGAVLRIGGVAATNVSVASDTSLTGTAPAGAVGKVDVVVVNPDLQLGRLSQGFTYTQPAVAGAITACNLQYPAQATGQPGATLRYYGRVYAKGVTDSAGQGAGIKMQFASAANAAALAAATWSDAVFNGGADNTSADEYQFDLVLPAAGSYVTSFRASLNGGAWKYCEADGIHDALDAANLGTLAVSPAPQPKVGWCTLVSTAVNAAPGTSTAVIGEVFAQNVTEAAGQGANVAMELGVGGTDGSGFTWTPASFSKDNFNNDQYSLSVSKAAGAYGVAYRASLSGGPWTYCEADGPHDALDAAHLGTLTVAAPQITACNLQFPAQATGQPGATVSYYGRVYAQGVTDAAGQGAGIEMQLASAADAAGLASATWTPAAFNAAADNSVTDEYQLGLVLPAVGNYVTAFRARLNGAAWKYCETDGMHDAIDAAHLGTLAVSAAPPPKVGWCRLESGDATAVPSAPVALVGQVYAQNVTEAAGQGANVAMELGVGAADGSGFTWTAATYSGDNANNDLYSASTAKPAGTYATAYRASLSGGPWTYCEKDGPHDALDAASLGTLTVAPPAVDYCNLQFPSSASGFTGDPYDLYGQVYENGLTEDAGPAPGIWMQAGVGQPDGGGFQWFDAGFNVQASANDEYRYTGSYGAPGLYGTAYRAMLQDAGTWVYCETDGKHAQLEPYALGTLSSRPIPTAVDDCKLQFPLSATAPPGASLDVYGRVLLAGATGLDAGAPRFVQMQASLDVLADGGGTWQDAGVFVSNPTGDPGWDEFKLTAAAPSTAGVHQLAFRARATDGGWSFCEIGGKSDSFSPADAGTLTVKPNSVDWCGMTSTRSPGGYYGDPLVLTGEVYVAGLTEPAGQAANIVVQAGIGQPDGGGFTWSAASYATDDTNNDVYAAFGNMPAPGTYATAMRASVNDGGWSYCEYAPSPSPSFDPADAGSVTVQATAVTDCYLQYPKSTDTTQFANGATATYYAHVLGNVAKVNGQYPGIVGQIGLGPVGSASANPDGGTGWTYYDAALNASCGSCGDGADEYQFALALAQHGTSDRVTYRFSGDGRKTWTYCDQDAGDGFNAGNLSAYSTLDNVEYDACKLTAAAASAGAGQGVAISAQVVKADGGSSYAVDTAQALIGPAGTDPGGPGWTAFSAGYDSGDISVGAGSTWTATVATDGGAYGVAFRFRHLSGGSWSYAAADGGCATGFQSGAEGSLTVSP